MGPTGLASECRGDYRGVRAGVSAGALSTDLVFNDGTTRPLTEWTAAASATWSPLPAFTLTGGAGALLGGSLAGDALSPGWLAFAGAIFVATRGGQGVPSVALAATISVASASARARSFFSGDLKLGATAAWPIARRFAPYVGATLFDGPVHYGAEKAQDRYHFQLVAGAALALPHGLDAFVEGSPLAERTLSAGAGWTF